MEVYQAITAVSMIRRVEEGTNRREGWYPVNWC